MTELDRILDTASDWHERGLEFALATVVGVRGSTYRGLGARQLVGADGSGVGTVSGGCLDADLIEVARQVIDSGSPRTVEFDLTADDEAVWGWGIGCNGATELVVEPAPGVVDFIDSIRGVQRPLVVVHQLSPGRAGEKTLVSPDGAGPFAAIAAEAVEEGRNRVAEVAGERVMIELLGAPRRLIVCGAGHDAVPVVKLAGELGYETVVVDDRRQFLSTDRFPGVAQLVQVEPRHLGDAVDLDGAASVVIMSHNYLRDLDYLESVLGHRLSYIGVLGPGERLARLLGDLAERAIRPDPHDLAVLHGPAGLDIGAEGPVEIAWSVLSEIMAVRRHRPAGFLRERKGPPGLREYDRPDAGTTSGEEA
ncbi:MAG TPA: XdhC family protein [Acidimicrobiia bacterium]|nr:XdhC family protein [Acidimicrobiia bacterium]